ncbi:hypothetical protein PPF1_36 [Rhizobium phage vB_RleM_PPF1]|uniref:hypothetical protein n=1 Tax=Rhizobium phage vB_RleM_PPF1 TaxID=1498228 RepID=UPI000499EDA8|nr:hypothetical protein PPF1_36 [Rhizobium phage vB_RleM_PPF1]AID18349.1 hypothetical protein PPF1_36 [Rhizobium phage vB_RleM_PPF1]
MSVLAPIVSACSLTNPKPEPIVITRTVTVVLPPECRKVTPALSPKPARDMTQEEIFNGWSADRTARNIGESRRAACVAAVDAAK